MVLLDIDLVFIPSTAETDALFILGDEILTFETLPFYRNQYGELGWYNVTLGVWSIRVRDGVRRASPCSIWKILFLLLDFLQAMHHTEQGKTK